jgi:hypothetical protein
MKRIYAVLEKLELDFQGSIEDLENIINRLRNGDLSEKRFTHWSIEVSSDCPDYSTLFLEKRCYETDEELSTRKNRTLKNYENQYKSNVVHLVDKMCKDGFSNDEIQETLGIDITCN